VTAALVLALLAMTGVLVAVLVIGGVRRRRQRHRDAPLAAARRRILFPFLGQALSTSALDAALRISRVEGAVLVPAYLAVVPRRLPLGSALPAECAVALPLLEAVEHRAAGVGVSVEARIERGRSVRHATRQLLETERYDRLVVPADSGGGDGFGSDDIAWLLRVVAGEIVVVRPADSEPVGGVLAPAGAA
jgi:hypothetical protein